MQSSVFNRCQRHRFQLSGSTMGLCKAEGTHCFDMTAQCLFRATSQASRSVTTCHEETENGICVRLHCTWQRPPLAECAHGLHTGHFQGAIANPHAGALRWPFRPPFLTTRACDSLPTLANNASFHSSFPCSLMIF